MEAAATVAIFNGLVRVADGTGIPLDEGTAVRSSRWRADLGLDRFAGSANTAATPSEAALPDPADVRGLFA